MIEINPRYYTLDSKTSVTSFGQMFTEFITNSIDASNDSGVKPIVKVTYTPEQRKISFLDNCRGMSKEELGDRILKIGNYTSYGDNSRGMMGRGAKDVSNLGKIEYITKRHGEVSSCFISKNLEGGFVSDYDESEVPSNNGTRVNVYFYPEIASVSTEEMRKSLLYEYSLRRILQNEDVSINYNGKRVIYTPPEGKLVMDTTFDVEWKDFKENDVVPKARLMLWVSDKPVPNPRSERERRNGILVSSNYENVYENSYLEVEGETNYLKYNRYSKYVYGELRCEYLDTLIRQHTIPGMEQEAGNYFLILDPSRRGLSKSHPFLKELYKIPRQLYQLTISRVSDYHAGDSFSNSDMNDMFNELAESLSQELFSEKEIYTWRTKEDQEILEMAKKALDNAVYDNDFFQFPDQNKDKNFKDKTYDRKMKISLIEDPDMVEPCEIIQLPFSIEIKVNTLDFAVSTIYSDIREKIIKGDQIPKSALAGIASIIRLAVTKIMARQELMTRASIDQDEAGLIDQLNKLTAIEAEIAGGLGKKIYYPMYKHHVMKHESQTLKYGYLFGADDNTPSL